MSGTGGTSLNVGFDGKKSKPGKGPSKALVERLSKKPDRTKVRAKPRESVLQEVSRAKPGERGAMKVNPVTGKMTMVKANAGKDMVREGSMYIPKEYLHAAAEAGLGNNRGIYSHMRGIGRELNGAHNTGASAGGSAPKRKSTYTPTVSKVSGNIHKINTTSGPPKRNNIKQVVQGRSRSITNKSSNQVNESSYTRSKGVVNNLGGCTSIRTRETSNERKTGIAQLGSCGGRSFVKHQKPAPGAKKKPVSKPVPEGPARRAGITKKLGGSGTAAKTMSSGGTNMSDREKRAAYFAAKFGKA